MSEMTDLLHRIEEAGVMFTNKLNDFKGNILRNCLKPYAELICDKRRFLITANITSGNTCLSLSLNFMNTKLSLSLLSRTTLLSSVA